MKTVLITGGAGYVGGRLTKALSQFNKVIISSRKRLLENELNAIGAYDAVMHSDLLNSETFPDGIDTIIHLAALNEHDCVKYPTEAILVNIDQTRIIVENAIAHKVANFIYFSTVHVYASPLKGLITEGTLPVPQHPYAITHRAAEDYVRAAALQKKIRGTIFRLSNSFGEPEMPDVNRWTLLLNDLCRQAIEKGSMAIHSSTNQLRDFITLTDVCKTLVAAVNDTSDHSFQLFNLSSNCALSLTDIAVLIQEEYKKIFDKKIEVNFPSDFSANVHHTLEISNEKLVNTYGVLENNFKQETQQLLKFCEKHFGKA